MKETERKRQINAADEQGKARLDLRAGISVIGILDI